MWLTVHQNLKIAILILMKKKKRVVIVASQTFLGVNKMVLKVEMRRVLMFILILKIQKVLIGMKWRDRL